MQIQVDQGIVFLEWQTDLVRFRIIVISHVEIMNLRNA